MTQANDLRKIETHMALTSAQMVSKMILPSLKEHNINFFYFHREYDDGSVMTLSSNASWSRNMFHQGYVTSKRKIIVPEYLTKPVNYFLWLPDMWPEMIVDAAINYDIANVIDISIQSKNYIDYFGYGARVRDNHIFNYYLSHLDDLENISRNFLYQAKDLIDDYEKDKIILVDSKSEHSIRKCKSNLSFRQKQCAMLIMQGKSTKEIAYLLNLSIRTIESYITTLKDKLACKNKYELIVKLQNKFELL